MPHARCSTRPARTLQRALALLCVVGGAQAATVYRCGSSYQDTPCPQAQVLELSDERSADQRRERLAATRGEQRLAAQMNRERLQLERSRPVQHQPVAIGPAPAPAPRPQALPPDDACPRSAAAPRPPGHAKARPAGKQLPCPSAPPSFTARMAAPKKAGLKAH